MSHDYVYTFIDSKSPAQNHFVSRFTRNGVRICAKSLTIHLQIDREIEVLLMNWIELDKLMRQSVSQAADSQHLKWIIWIMNVGCMLLMYEKSSRFYVNSNKNLDWFNQIDCINISLKEGQTIPKTQRPYCNKKNFALLLTIKHFITKLDNYLRLFISVSFIFSSKILNVIWGLYRDILSFWYYGAQGKAFHKN